MEKAPKSPLNNKGRSRGFQNREKENTSQGIVLNDNLQNQINDLLNNSGRRRQLSRRRRTRRRKESNRGEVGSSFHNVSSSNLNASLNVSQSLNESQDLDRSFRVETLPKETKDLPETVQPKQIVPPSPSHSTISNQSFTSCYSTSGKAPNRLLLRLEAKQKKYQLLSAKLIGYERDLFETKNQLHDRIDEINELNERMKRREHKLSIQRQELVERCDELNSLKKRMEKEAASACTLRQTLDQKEMMWKSNMVEVTKSNRKLLAETIQDWEDKFVRKNEELNQKDRQLEEIGSRMKQVENEVKDLKTQLSISHSKLDERNEEIGEKLGELIALRKEKIELEKSVLCLSKHIEKERRLRVNFEERSRDYDSLLEGKKKQEEENKRLRHELASLRELREKEASMVRTAMDRMTACSEMMKENLPHVLNRENMKNRKFEDWNVLTDRSNLFLSELKKKLDQYRFDDEKEILPKQIGGKTDYVNPFVQFCSNMYMVFKKLVGKQQDVNSINNCYINKIKEKEQLVESQAKKRRKRRPAIRRGKLK